MVPESESTSVATEFAASQQQSPTIKAVSGTAGSAINSNSAGSGDSGKGPSRRPGACRVCLKSFKPDDYSKTCYECQQRVCEDCASYSKLDENDDAVS